MSLSSMKQNMPVFRNGVKSKWCGSRVVFANSEAITLYKIFEKQYGEPWAKLDNVYIFRNVEKKTLDGMSEFETNQYILELMLAKCLALNMDTGKHIVLNTFGEIKKWSSTA